MNSSFVACVYDFHFMLIAKASESIFRTSVRKMKKATLVRWPDLFDFYWWAMQGSNLRHLPCEGSALPLS